LFVPLWQQAENFKQRPVRDAVHLSEPKDFILQQPEEEVHA